MKLSDYIAQNGDREIDSKKLDELLQIKSKVWKPKKGDKYWHIRIDGDVDFAIWINKNFDLDCWEIGNVFLTKKAAQAHVEYLKTKTALRRYAQEHNDKELDWNNPGQGKLYLSMNKSKINLALSYTDKSVGEVYFSSREIAQAAIEEIGEARIKKYLLYDEEELKTNLCDHLWDVFKARDKNGKIIDIYKCSRCNAEEILKYPTQGDGSI